MRFRSWTGSVFLCVSAFCASACGGDSDKEEAQNTCNTIIEAYATYWDRCDVESHDLAVTFWEEALDCDAIDSQSGDPTECIDTIESGNCANAKVPSQECTELLSAD